LHRARLVALIRRLTLIALLLGFAAVPVVMALQATPTGPIVPHSSGNGIGC
jgi:hypothetical protein